MVVSGLIDGYVFCKDMGDVCLTDVTGTVIIEYIVTDDSSPFPDTGLAVFKESYYPDSLGQILIHGLGEVAFDYFTKQKIPISGMEVVEEDNHLYITCYVYDADGNSIAHFNQGFYYSNCRTNIVSTRLCDTFLNRRSEFKIREEQWVFVSFMLREKSFKIGVSYIENNCARYSMMDIGPEFSLGIMSGGHAVYPIGVSYAISKLKELNNIEISPDKVLYIDAYLYKNGELKDKMHAEVDRTYYSNIQHFIYFNCFGLPETLYFTGKDERSTELNASYGSVVGSYLKMHTDLITSHTVNTGYINENVRDCVEDMVYSSKVYLYEGDKLGDLVTITEVDFMESKPRTEPLNIKLTYRVADKCQRNFARGKLRENIFDKTFDSTFD